MATRAFFQQTLTPPPAGGPPAGFTGLVAPADFEEDSSAVVIPPGWQRDGHPLYSNGQAVYTSDPGNTINFSFYGSRIQLIQLTGENFGTAVAVLDSGPDVLINQYEPGLVAAHLV